MEILGQFTSDAPLSISDIAMRMGRPAGALYYHVGMLEKLGLLKRAGTRPAGKRHEALFEPVAQRFALAADPTSPEGIASALKAASAAFRMTERDLEAALRSGSPRQTGEDRNFFATRMHGRVSPALLAEINGHFDAIYEIVKSAACAPETTSASDEYCSITLALLPLRGRKTDPEPPQTGGPK